MSEPIRLWDKSGNLWVTFSPSAAQAAVTAGTYTREQPTQSIYETPFYGAGKIRPATEIIAALTPNDTQEVDAVPVVLTPKRARKGDKGGGVL